MQPLYTARGHNTGGREGRARAADGYPDVVMRIPPELGGKATDGDATNPEELFGLGYGGCFLSALQFVARQQKISAKAFELDSTVMLIEGANAMHRLAVELRAELPGVEPDKAAELMRAAHELCPYSRATKGNIEVALFVGDQAV